MLKPLDFLLDIMDMDGSQGFMYYIDGWTTLPSYPYFENWMIIARPSSPLIHAWFEEFHKVIDTYAMGDLYLKDLEGKIGVERYRGLLQLNPMPSYLKQHMALQKVMQIDGMTPFSGIDGADSSYGPLYLAELAHWENDRMAVLLMEEWREDPHHVLPPFIKIRSEDRKWLDYFTGKKSSLGMRWKLWNWRRLLKYTIFGSPKLHKKSILCRFLIEC
jgi:hypothetical protein